MSTARRDELHRIECEVQKRWEQEKVFEEDAPDESSEKFFATFPYPYMNGLLHIGHAFSLTKAIFATNFNRLQGKKVLFPFGYHCTGMPIQAAANKLRRELEKFGEPSPVFPAGMPQVVVNKEDVPEFDAEGRITLKWKVPPATGNKAIKEFRIMCALKGEEFKHIVSVPPSTDPACKLMKHPVQVESGTCTYMIETTLKDGSACPSSEISGEVSFDDAPAKKNAAPGAPGKRVAKKILMKTGGAAFQYEILLMMGIHPSEIPRFSDPEYWVQYFPPLGTRDLKRFGCPSDFRRSFVTTSLNPYYDQFIRWQFRKLQKGDKIGFGKRPTIFSELDGQACMDHDRAEGEGVAPQEYTAIKIQLLEFPTEMSSLKQKKVFLLAGTLRPETMPGQTNCWILPEGEYGCFKAGENEVYICSKRSARNMSFQDILEPRGQPECLLTIRGRCLLGKKVRCPQSAYPEVHILPLLTIKMDKATGVVTSVPSDSPDDFAAFSDMLKPGKRDHFGIKKEWVEPFKLVPILSVEIDGEVREMSAQYMCEKLGVQSQNDKEKLQEAHDTCYKLGFDKGVMTTGPMKGMPVKKAKFEFRNLMIEAGEAFLYSEPEKKVVSRSGDECVVAGVDQWYLKYGESEWRKQVETHLKSSEFNTYNERIKESFLDAIAWLKEWACSRSFGLGTRVPWDEKFLIESLSDSTIYMAYYTIAHLLQGGDILGSKPGPLGIKPEDLTDEVFDFIFLKGPRPKKCNIKTADLDRLQKEFRFWYPLDLRVSARDLVQNHLTMALYNHAAVWDNEPAMWPRSIYCNGMLLMDNEKMSKSKGNFFTLQEIMDKYSADAVRLACASAGDTLLDGNFETKVAEKGVLDLYVLLDRVKAAASGAEQFESGDTEARFVDRWFANEMNRLVQEAYSWYEKMCFREALRACYYEFGNAADQYRNVCKAGQMLPNKDLMLRYYDWQMLILSPICPHICEYGMQLLGKKQSIQKALWPHPTGEVQQLLIDQGRYLFDKAPHDFTLLLKKSTAKGGTPKNATIYVASEFPEWKKKVLDVLSAKMNAGKLPLLTQDELKADKDAAEAWKKIMQDLLQDPTMKPFGKHLGPFAAFKRDEAAASGKSALSPQAPFDELQLVQEHIAYLESRVGLPADSLSVKMAKDASGNHADKAGEAQPLKPAIVFDIASTGSTGAGSTGAGPTGAGRGKTSFTPVSDLKALDTKLSTLSYIEGGHQASQADFMQLEAISSLASKVEDHPHVARWAKHIKALSHRRRQF